MAVIAGLFKAKFCGPLATYYRDLAIVLVAGHRHALRAAGFAPLVAHADTRDRTPRGRVHDRFDQWGRRIDRDRGARIVRDADVAPSVASVIPGREWINVS